MDVVNKNNKYSGSAGMILSGGRVLYTSELQSPLSLGLVCCLCVNRYDNEGLFGFSY